MRFLQAISRLLATQTSAFIILVAILTFWKPELFLWVKGDVQTAILGIIMLTMGMTLTTEDFRILAKRPLDIFIGACAQYTIMPLLAYSLVKLMNLPNGIAAGLILVGCCPGGVSSNIMSFLCKGDVAFSVGMTTASTLLAPVATPLLVLWLSGSSIEVDTWGMFRSILIVTIIPVALGAFANFFCGKRKQYQELCSVMPGVSVIGLACIVGGVISYNGEHFFSSGAMIFAAVFLHNSLGYALGYAVGNAPACQNRKNGQSPWRSACRTRDWQPISPPAISRLCRMPHLPRRSAASGTRSPERFSPDSSSLPTNIPNIAQRKKNRQADPEDSEFSRHLPGNLSKALFSFFRYSFFGNP